LVLTELPRAIRAKAEINPRLDLDLSLGRSEVILQRVEMHPIDRLTLWRAGRIFEPHLRSFDAVHVMTALNARPIDAFVTYDIRQAEAALVEGLNVRSPGA
jgi:predicted nucleic acid-binding protein